MTIWDKYFTIAAPQAMLANARMILRGIDTDVGGELSFSLKARDKDVPSQQFWIQGAHCTTECFNDYLLWVTDANTLYDYLVQDRDVRWHGRPLPTLQEVIDFIGGIRYSTAHGYDAALAEMNLEKVDQV